MKIQSAVQETVCGVTSKLPEHADPEIAFAGKSNVGKSSLINKLMNRKSLARTSSSPGKTQTINFYRVNDRFFLVDLPGYGYARASAREKQQWGVMIERYLHSSPQLKAVFLLIDIRHEPGENDIQMFRWICACGFTPVIAATKADKISRAAADASVGGKTAVDTPLATNLIGMFNQPLKVYIDIDCWKTLPKRQLSSGLAETIKHACLGDREMFEYLEGHIEDILAGDAAACEYIAERNCDIKYRVVMQDERESGLREILNLGHTVGRAIETVSDYTLLHGEAVSIGLAAQARLSRSFGFMTYEEVARVERLLERAGLPVRIPEGIDRGALLKKLYTDKKVRDGKLRFVLQQGIGGIVQFGDNDFAKRISEEEIGAVLETM